MRYLLLGSLLLLHFLGLSQVTHVPNPRAKGLGDSAIHMFQMAAGNAAKVKQAMKLLDQSVKIDKYYYDGWLSKMTIQSSMDKFADALATLQQMDKLFPKDLQGQFYTGILLYKVGRKDDAKKAFEKQVDLYNSLLSASPASPNAKGWLINKGIVLILADREFEGKQLLRKVYADEKQDYDKSYIAFYINSNKEQIINDRIPGK